MSEPTEKLDKKNIQDILALTPMQQGMLYHYLNKGEGQSYFEQLTLQLAGEIDPLLFRRTWQILIEHHEMLRTIFRWDVIEKPLQIILRTHNLPVNILRAADAPLPPQAGWEDLKAAEQAEIDIRKTPLRVLLYIHEKKQARLVLTYYHIICDGWSTSNLLKDFFQIYSDLTKQLPPRCALRPGFKTYLKWLQQTDTQAQAEYWRSYLQGITTRTELPGQRRDAGQTSSSQVYSSSVQLARRCAELLTEEGITMPVLLYAAWGLLLQKYSNSADVLFGITISGRPPTLPGIEDMTGLFINTLPLRAKTTAGQTVQQLLRQIQNDLQQREGLEGSSLVEIKKHSELEGKEQLFDSIVVVENYPLHQLMENEQAGLTITALEMFEATNFELTLAITTFFTIEIKLIYAEQRFTAAEADQLMSHYWYLLEQIVSSPEQCVAGLSLLRPTEREQLLNEFTAPIFCLPGESDQQPSGIKLPFPLNQSPEGLQACIIDRDGHPLPAGITGQLYLETSTQSPANESGLTLQQKHFSNTGQLARLLSGGKIELRGTTAQQLIHKGHQLNTFLIEVGLRQSPGISGALLCLLSEETGKTQLVAFITSSDAIDTQSLSETLAAKFPAYMLPEAIYRLEQFPLTATGEIDTAALKIPTAPPAAAQAKSGDESNNTYKIIESRILEIWQTLLKRQDFGVKDNFFDIGGNSIMFVPMHMKIDNIYPGLITWADLFSYPTVEKAARFVLEKQQTNSQPLLLTALSLPADYAALKGSEQGPLLFTQKIAQPILTQIQKLATRTAAQPEDLFAALYLLLFKEISGLSVVTVYLTEAEWFVALTVDFAQLTEFEALSRLVHTCRIQSAQQIPLPASEQNLQTTADAGIVPGLSWESLPEACLPLSGFFDILMEIDLPENQLHYRFNPLKFNRKKALEITNDYTDLLQQITAEASS